jgi:hypothetical protein
MRTRTTEALKYILSYRSKGRCFLGGALLDQKWKTEKRIKRIDASGRLGREFKRPHVMPEAGLGYLGVW